RGRPDRRGSRGPAPAWPRHAWRHAEGRQGAGSAKGCSMNADVNLVPDSTLVDVPGEPWVATRFPGIDWKILMKDDATGMFTALMRWAPGARLPLHEHAALEQ